MDVLKNYYYVIIIIIYVCYLNCNGLFCPRNSVKSKQLVFCLVFLFIVYSPLQIEAAWNEYTMMLTQLSPAAQIVN